MVLFTEGLPAEQLVGAGGRDDRALPAHRAREDIVVRMDVPGRWAGGFRAWDEHGTYLATGRVVSPGRVLRPPVERAAGADPPSGSRSAAT